MDRLEQIRKEHEEILRAYITGSACELLLRR
ncbi:MAG: hypothetical protein BWY65_02399 [Firmicutes bacterium ADurb.Bin373]|nr:MAG: hypothetical protein BWY65_02399 [Firmicutes bacterium ADurb.Bin373]